MKRYSASALASGSCQPHSKRLALMGYLPGSGEWWYSWYGGCQSVMPFRELLSRWGVLDAFQKGGWEMNLVKPYFVL